MAEITLVVPDENCKDCDFKSCSTYENHQNYVEKNFCRIFSCNIYDNKKCTSCKLLTKKQSEVAI